MTTSSRSKSGNLSLSLSRSSWKECSRRASRFMAARRTAMGGLSSAPRLTIDRAACQGSRAADSLSLVGHGGFFRRGLARALAAAGLAHQQLAQFAFEFLCHFRMLAKIDHRILLALPD